MPPMMPCVTQYWMPGYAQFFSTSVNICVTSTLTTGIDSVFVSLQRVQA